MSRFINFWAFSIFFSVQSDYFLRGQELNEVASRKCSVFQATFDNSEAIRSGNVLVKRTIVHDTVQTTGEKNKGVFRESKFIDRVIFNIDDDRYCHIKVKDTEWIDFGDDLPKNLLEDLVSTPTAWCTDWKLKTAYNSQSNDSLDFRIFGKSSLNEALTRSGYIDPRLFGLMTFENLGLLDHAKDYYAKRASGLHFLDESVIGNKLKIRLIFEDRQGVKLREVFEFDGSNSLLRRFSAEAWHDEDKRWYPQNSFEIDWKKVDDFFVPVEATCSSFRSLDSSDGKTYYGEQETKIELHWYSVNQAIDSKYFDGSVVRSSESILELLKPQKKELNLKKNEPNQNQD